MEHESSACACGCIAVMVLWMLFSTIVVMTLLHTFTG